MYILVFLSHIVLLFLGQHICMANIVFLLQMCVQILMYDACQRLSGHMFPLNNFMIPHHLKQKYELSWFLCKYIYWNMTILYIFS